MNTDDILGEIRRTREKQAAECGFDPKRIGDRLREQQREREAAGVKYVSFAKRGVEGGSCVVREEPGVSGGGC